MPEVRRTRATLRSAELGFLGVWVNTRVHTPRRWGDPLSAGVFDFSGLVSRPLRTSCWIVGTELLRASNRLRDSRWANCWYSARGEAPGRPNMLAEPRPPRQAWPRRAAARKWLVSEAAARPDCPGDPVGARQRG